MRLYSNLLFCSAFFASTHADAFRYSAGWSPGQAVPTGAAPAPATTFKPGAETGGKLSWSSLLTSGPIGSLLSRTGVNITERLEEAQKKAVLPWDERIPMIRDDNYEELVFNEAFATPEEERDRVWFLIVTTTSTQRTGLSAFLDEQFNEAFNESLIEQDLPNVRWGRIDYLNVTRLTTKWAVWNAPLFIVAKDRGRTLRFVQPQQSGGRSSILRKFLKEESWAHVPPWTGAWAPGGSREKILDKFAVFQEKLYFYTSKIPRWMYLLLSGGVGSIALQLLHRKPNKPAAPTMSPSTEAQTQQTIKAASSAVEPKRAAAKRRDIKK